MTNNARLHQISTGLMFQTYPRKALNQKVYMNKRLLQALFASTIAFGLSQAHGATLFVTNSADSGTGTLRERIASANSGDTISISTAHIPIFLNSEIVISKNLAINGDPIAGFKVS